jgi:ribosomal protein L7/L12
MTRPPHPLPTSVQKALHSGDKLMAIQLLRASAGLDLKAAKDAVERGGLDTLIPPDVVEPALLSLPPAVREAMRRGQKVDAIRLLREATGMGLKEARQAVEGLASEVSAAEHGLGPGEQPRARWAWAVAWAALLLAGLGYAWWGR